AKGDGLRRGPRPPLRKTAPPTPATGRGSGWRWQKRPSAPGL
ncbi:MAG: hypothetical protein AVDCRST_MAG02-1457, partial [uncultured Rubrobacteraceae bacterium]